MFEKTIKDILQRLYPGHRNNASALQEILRVFKGGKLLEDNPHVVKLLQEGYSIREVAEQTGVNRGKVHRISKALDVKTSVDLV